MFSRLIPLCLLLFVSSLFSGCMLGDTTKTPRSGIEQLILSTAADHALANTSLPFLSGKKVWINEAYFESYDKLYMLAAIRQKILRDGGEILTVLPIQKDSALPPEIFYKDTFIIEVASGGIGTDQDDSIVGIPAIPIAVPFTDLVFAFPEISLLKRARQYAMAKFIVTAREAGSGKLVASTRTLLGSSYYTRWDILMTIKWSFADIPEEIADVYDIAT